MARPLSVGARPTGAASPFIDLDEFHILRHEDAIARDTAQNPVHRRDDAMSVDKTEHIVLEHARADVERRAPNAVSGRIDETVAANAAEVARNMVIGPGLARFHQLAGMIWMRLYGEVAIRSGGELRAEADGEIGDVAQIGRHAALLHSRIDQHIGSAESNEIHQLQRRHRDGAHHRQHLDDLQRGLAAVALDAVKLGVIIV